MNAVTRFWIAFGSRENCETAFRRGIWGLKTTQQSRWETISESGDVVFFYAGKPVSGIIGCATVLRKYRDNKPEWPEERKERKAIWPLRFQFSFKFRIDPSFWHHQKIQLVELEKFRQGGFQELPVDIAQKLLSLFPATATMQDIGAVELPVKDASPLHLENPHDQAKLWLVDIGRMQGFIPETEYPVLTKRVDVVWRRLELSVPSHVFEVQVGGNLTEAIGKLKHAYELWNSKILLVAAKEHLSPFKQLIGGSFREIGERAKFIELAHIEELYQRKRAYRELEAQLGILV